MQQLVMLTDNGDGSARVTLSGVGADIRFSIAESGDKAVIEYEETMLGRGNVRVSQPDEDIWRAVATSDEVTEWIEDHNLTGVKLERNA